MRNIEVMRERLEDTVKTKSVYLLTSGEAEILLGCMDEARGTIEQLAHRISELEDGE